MGRVVSFIDDVIIGTEGKEGYDEIVEEVIKRLAKNDLYVELEKCKQKVKEVGFLGVVIRPEGIRMEKEKVKGILDQPTPQGVKNVQKFLELANYYHRFIKDFTIMARLLHNMVKKDQKQKWMERQDKIFSELKERFMKKPVLAVPDLDKKK